MQKPVYIVATIRTQPGKEAEAEAVFQSLLEPTHREAGCVRYTLHKRLDQPGTYYFIEQWRSTEGMQKHLGSPHIQAVLARQKELLTLLDIATVEPLPGGDPEKGTLW